MSAIHMMRYGDGEFMVLYGIGVKKNCDGHSFEIPEMIRDLRETVDSPKDGLTYCVTQEAREYLRKKSQLSPEKRYPNIQWDDGDLFMNLNLTGKYGEWIDQWESLSKVLVGPAHLKRLPFWTGDINLIVMNDTDCYSQKEWAIDRLMVLKDYPIDVIFFSACVLSEILIYTMHEHFPDTNLIDVGAFWDPHCGVKSREFYR